MRAYHTVLNVMMVCMLSAGLQAQVCDPSVAPTGLVSTYFPGTGALLEWNAIPGSVGVQLKVDLPSGSSINRRIIGLERDQFAVPDALLSPGTYTWRVQAACSTVPPYSVTPISTSNSFTVGGAVDCPDTVTDIDGNVYNTVLIGSQCWMAENLKVERYRNGNNINTGLSSGAWQITSTGAFAVYNNIAANKEAYGLLYNYYAAVDFRGLCPTGWHVPTDAEWTLMYTVLDPFTCGSCTGISHSTNAGSHLKATGTLGAGTGLWQVPNIGATNSSGFSGLPGGTRFLGVYSEQGFYGYWWTSSETFSSEAWMRILGYNYGSASRLNAYKRDGYSVRCVRD